MADKKEAQEPKSWRDIIADGIEEARANTVEIMHEVATGEQYHEERFQYTDLGEFFSKAAEQPLEAKNEQEKDHER